MSDDAPVQEPVIIRKYANRRLYDTGISAYITLEDLCARVKAGEEFIVLDAKTGQDLTRQVLTQIILEQEIKGFELLPTNFLRNVIRFYDGKMQGVLQPYLEASMKTFIANQERMHNMLGKAVDGMTPFGAPFAPFEEIARQNMAFFEKTVQFFNPFGAMRKDTPGQPEESDARTKR